MEAIAYQLLFGVTVPGARSGKLLSSAHTTRLLTSFCRFL